MLRTFASLVTLALVLGSSTVAFADDLTDQSTAVIESIEAGDIVVVRLADSKKRVKVRVIGIDCSTKAKSAAKRLAVRQQVKLRSDKPFLPIAQDQFGRYVAYVELADGRDFGVEMLRSGECTSADWKFPHPRLTQYASISN